MSLGKSRNVTPRPRFMGGHEHGPEPTRSRKARSGRRSGNAGADCPFGAPIREAAWCGLLILAAGLGSGAAILAQDAAAPRNTDPDVAYMGSKVCAGCHREIYDSYVRRRWAGP